LKQSCQVVLVGDGLEGPEVMMHARSDLIWQRGEEIADWRNAGEFNLIDSDTTR
jgi:hypothetical protein